jgi:HEAT repeat protein
MNLVTIVLTTALVLTFLSLILLVITIGLRMATDRRLRRDAEFRNKAKPILRSFLSGEAPLEAAKAALSHDSHRAIQLLQEESDSLGEEGRMKLHPLLALMPVEKDMMNHITSRRWEKRLRSAEYLGYLGDDSALPALMTALRDDVLAVRFAAANSLARLGCQNAVEPILKALDVPGEVSQRRVVEVLQILGPGVSEQILTILNDSSGNPTSLAIAARMAGSLRVEHAVKPLCELLRNENANIRINSIRALASINDHSVTDQIAALSVDPSWEVRSSVMLALGRLGATPQIPLLLHGLSDRDWWVRFNAAESIYALGESGVTALKNAADHHEDPYGRDMARQILQEHGIIQSTTVSKKVDEAKETKEIHS